jgi:hypothetical protein
MHANNPSKTGYTPGRLDRSTLQRGMDLTRKRLGQTRNAVRLSICDSGRDRASGLDCETREQKGSYKETILVG